jgi:hypothetical protein
MLLLGWPGGVAADGPNNGNIIVPVDHLMPGEQFRITGFGIDPGIALSLTLASGQRADTIGTVTVARDGTIETTGVVAGDFPLGYAELRAASAADGTWTTAVLVGPRAEGPGNGNAAAVPGEAVALLVLAVGILIFVLAAASYVRGRRMPRVKPD